MNDFQIIIFYTHFFNSCSKHYNFKLRAERLKKLMHSRSNTYIYVVYRLSRGQRDHNIVYREGSERRVNKSLIQIKHNRLFPLITHSLAINEKTAVNKSPVRIIGSGMTNALVVKGTPGIRKTRLQLTSSKNESTSLFSSHAFLRWVKSDLQEDSEKQSPSNKPSFSPSPSVSSWSNNSERWEKTQSESNRAKRN